MYYQQFSTKGCVLWEYSYDRGMSPTQCSLQSRGKQPAMCTCGWPEKTQCSLHSVRKALDTWPPTFSRGFVHKCDSCAVSDCLTITVWCHTRMVKASWAFRGTQSTILRLELGRPPLSENLPSISDSTLKWAAYMFLHLLTLFLNLFGLFCCSHLPYYFFKIFS